jgi:Mg-chelatase subunit ChlD
MVQTSTDAEIKKDANPMETDAVERTPTEQANTANEVTAAPDAELDLVFAFDCTGSMGSYLYQAQSNIKSIAQQIITSEHASVRMALVAYRDNPPQDKTFATSVHDFTSSLDEMETSLMRYTAQGGGDGPECVADALYEVSNLKYRPSAAKICVFIADAPPHGLGESGDGFPNGSPNGHDPYAISRRLSQIGVTVYAVGCEPVLSTSYRFARTFFESIAEVTGGQYVTLSTSQMLADVIIGGAREEIALEKLMAAAKQELEDGIRQGAIDRSDDHACQRYLSEQMVRKGAKVSSLRCSGRELPKHSPMSKEWARCESLDVVREKTSAMSLSDKATSALSKKTSRFTPKKKSMLKRAPAPSAPTALAHAPAACASSFLEAEAMFEGGSYSCEVADVSEAQCERLFSKLKSRS